jgi:Winged helix DNA-binding domain
VASRDPLRGREPALSVTWGQVCGWRLAQQHVTHPDSDPITVAAALGGVQAQVTASAQFTLGRRSTAMPEDIDRALWVDRHLVKTWAMRGTLHWLPVAEYPLWVAALRAREWPITPGWEKYHGVTKAELDAITEAIPEALQGRQLTREELADRLAEVTNSPHLAEQLRSGWGAVLKPAANRGLLCFGPDRGRNVVFVHPSDWLGDMEPEPDRETALRTVLYRFLDAYGPATHADFGRWFGVAEKPAREIVAAYADELAVAEVDGAVAGWITPTGAEALASAPPASGVVLLGGFDPYVLAPLSHRAAIIPDGHIDEVSRAAGWISAVVLVDGFVAGTWTSDQTPAGTTIDVQLFAPLPSDVAAELTACADALGKALVPAPVTVRIAGVAT